MRHCPVLAPVLLGARGKRLVHEAGDEPGLAGLQALIQLGDEPLVAFVLATDGRLGGQPVGGSERDPPGRLANSGPGVAGARPP